MKPKTIIPILALLLSASVSLAQMPSPLLAVPDQVVLQDDFSTSGPLDKSIWQKRQGTRWEIADGVLKGQQSSPEYQASKEDHFGYEPRLSVPVTPAEFLTTFRIRFLNGTETSIVPFIEFGHHVCRVRFSDDGASLLVDHEMWKVDEAPDFLWESGKWYDITAEMKDSQFVMQIKDGPTLFATHESFASPPTSGGKGLGVAGPRKGKIEIDDLTIWSTKPQVQPGWEKRRASFPNFTPVQVKQPKPSGANKRSNGKPAKAGRSRSPSSKSSSK